MIATPSKLFHTLKRTVAPAALAVSVDTAKSFMRVDCPEEDELIAAYIRAATEKVENDTRRGFITQTWQLSLDCFCDHVIPLQRCPVQSATITYIDEDGDSTSLSSSLWQLDNRSEPGRLYPAYGQTWPTVQPDTLNAVTVLFPVGYGTAASSVPDMAAQAILLLTSSYYNIRCAVAEAKYAPVPLGYESLIQSLRWD